MTEILNQYCIGRLHSLGKKKKDEVKLRLILYLGFKIPVHHTLKVAESNNIQYLYHDSLGIIFCVFSTPAENRSVVHKQGAS